MIYRSYFESPIGIIEVTTDDNYVLKTDLVKKRKYYNENYLSKKAIQELKEYFNKKRKEFDLPIKLNGTEFQLKVWNELLKIPYGSTCSYKDIANNIGNIKAFRAVGSTVGKNPIFIIIPCHRVIGSNNKLTGFAFGIDTKKYLLELEK